MREEGRDGRGQLKRAPSLCFFESDSPVKERWVREGGRELTGYLNLAPSSRRRSEDERESTD